MTIPIDIHIDGRRVADVLIPSILSHLETQEQAYMITDLIEIEPVQLQMTFDYSEYPEEARANLQHHSANLYRIVEYATDEAGRELYEAKQEIHHYKKDGWTKWAESSECPFSVRHADRLIERWEQKYFGHHVRNQIEQPVEQVEEIPEVRPSRTTNEEKRKTVEDYIAVTPLWRQMSNREIARICGVTEHLVRTIRAELEPKAAPEPTPEPEPTQTIVESTAHVDNIPVDVDNVPTPKPEPEQGGSTVLPPLEVSTEPEPIIAPNPVVEEEKSEAPVKSPALTALQSSESNEWYTPLRYINAASELMGGIDLDPASCEQANSHVKAAEFYDISRNGLKEDWPKRVWLNPPYGFTEGESNQSLWSKHLIDQYEDGPTTEAVLLVNANIEAKWFQPLYDYPICFVDHRIHFYSPNGDANQPTQGNAFVYFGPEEKYGEFKRIFSKFGPIGRFERDK